MYMLALFPLLYHNDILDIWIIDFTHEYKSIIMVMLWEVKMISRRFCAEKRR